MGWVESESVWLFRPDLADVFVRRKSPEGLQATGEVVGGDEVGQVALQLIVSLVVVALDRGLFEGPVHPLDLSVRPRVIRFGYPMLDAMALTTAVEGVAPPHCSGL